MKARDKEMKTLRNKNTYTCLYAIEDDIIILYMYMILLGGQFMHVILKFDLTVI